MVILGEMEEGRRREEEERREKGGTPEANKAILFLSGHWAWMVPGCIAPTAIWRILSKDPKASFDADWRC